MKPTVDPKRTVPATQAGDDDPHLQPGMYTHGEPGKARQMFDGHLSFCCPGCEVTGAIRCGHPKPDNGNGATWDIVAGSLDDVTTLSLSPSIHCVGCCGWHGYLTAGVFRSC